MPRRRPDFESDEGGAEAAKLKKFGDTGGLKSGGCPTQPGAPEERFALWGRASAETILESRAVYMMLAHIRTLLPPLLSLVFLIAASGLYNTFASVRLELEGIEKGAIGIVVSALYVGILIGSLTVDRWIIRWGHVKAYIAFALSISLLVIAQGFWVDPYYWSCIRLAGGVAMAGIFVVIESWLLIQTSASMRGAILSIYLAVFYAALSGGQLLINAADLMTIRPFLLIAALSTLSILPLTLRKVAEPKMETQARLSLGELFRLSPLGFLGGIVSGMLLAAVYGLVPIYAKEVGMSIADIGNLMALLIFGGLCFQWPFGRWADKGSRRRVLLVASFLTTLCGIAIALLDRDLTPLLFLLAFAFGGFSFTIYPLSMAHACEKLTDAQIVPATSGFVLSYGFGAIASPLIAPFAMTFFGSPGLFYFMAAISLLLVLFGLKTRVPNREN